MEYSIRIGGEAGQGLLSIGNALAKILSRAGFHVFTHQDYMSRIRGGHNFYQIRFSDSPVAAAKDLVDVLLALDMETIERHRQELRAGGKIVYDAATLGQKFSGQEFVDIPMARTIEEKGADRIMVNSVAIGSILGLFGLGVDLYASIIRSTMQKKGEGVITTNIAVAQAGMDYVEQNYPEMDSLKVVKPETEGQMLITGNQAIGLGALVSGCKFFAAYPMSPSTSIMQYLADKAAEYGIVVEQAEDEIAAINMALGASYGGVRAMTATSGGGFALMTEGISLAGITETPVVIAEVQRPGPATGLPTRTEQGDLFFVIHGGHGEFPRVVLTPGTPEQAFHLTNKAFHLAEKYQIPVIIQSDQYLADSEWTFPKFETECLLNEDFRLRDPAVLQGMSSYKRYAQSDNGISPLAVPGASRHLVAVDSDEHDADGHIIEDASTRIAMVEKRLHKKMSFLRQEIAPPTYLGDRAAEAVLVGYGSTFGVLQEVYARLAKQHRIGFLHFTEVWPFPLLEKFDYVTLLKQAPLTICVENNATGQFARLMRMETGFEFAVHINKYDGRPFLLDTLMGEINDHLRQL